MVGVQGTSDPNPELLDAMAMGGHLVPASSVHWFLAEHRQRLFPDDLFADLFGSGRGRPSVPADVIATVMVLQALEGLSDRDAAQLRMNIVGRWRPGRRCTTRGSIRRCSRCGATSCGPVIVRNGSSTPSVR